MPTTHHCQACTKNGFCRKHQVVCPVHPKVVYYKPGGTGHPQKSNKCILDTLDLSDINEVQDVTLLAQGGYNFICLVKMREPVDIRDGSSSPVGQFILRLPSEDALLPNQVTNEVAFRRFIATNLPHIPVPHVYDYQATSDFKTSFIVEEFIDAKPLSEQWMSLDASQKESLAQKLAAATVDLAQVQFNEIGGLDPIDMSPAPTVEGCKLFKGRAKFHREECYPIGPYSTTKEYILAGYEREIYYYTHASRDDIDEGLFTDIYVEDFVETLRNNSYSIAATDIADEPFVLAHGDFHGRNILVRDGQIVAVLDWEFAGSYPLSEIMSSGEIDVVEPEDDEMDAENWTWKDIIRDLILKKVTERGWDQMGLVRSEILPYAS
ncbi:kinase-like domain-containing protein [Hypoxylon sp. FL1857]|nr:kinase-like domain-containing protein [Hypoxylon sp. FL1857]